MASVDWVVDHQDCAASSGSYTIRIRYRDENNEVQDLEVEETWQRDDNSPVVGHGDYLIGDNADLVNVRSRSMRCQCAAPVQETNDQ